MSEHIFKESLKELAEAAIKRGWDAGYDAAIKDVVAWLRADEQNIEGYDPHGEILYAMATPSVFSDAIERGDAKGASNE